MSDLFSYDDGDSPAPVMRPVPPPPTIQSSATDSYLSVLNDSQREAVEKLDGPVLVLAGAGTGKTRVLTTRLGHLLNLQRARPWNVLAVTFTNKAAGEMKERVAAIIGPAAEQLWLGTFHALGAKILRRHAELVGLQSNFTILDADDQQRLVKQLLQAEGIDDKKWPARMVLTVIQRWKDRGQTPDKVSVADSGDIASGRLHDIYRLYQERLQVLNAADFGDLLLLNLKLFQENPDILEKYQQKFSYILVDEYQDTNVAQYLWLRLLAQAHKNICCVGDDDQSIYGWRGAEIGNILKFEKDFSGAVVVRLEQNYRSTTRILAAAGGLIAQNEQRLGKTLWTDGDHGEPIMIHGLWDGEEEARKVADEVEVYQRRGTPLEQIAILVRAGFQTREFEERFITLGVPYRVVGGARFYERLEIRDAIAYLRLIHQPADDLAFERIINKPARGIGKTTLQSIHGLARVIERPLMHCANELLGSDELRPAGRRSLSAAIAAFDRWRILAQTMHHTELAALVLDESGYTEMWQKDKNPEAPGRLENLKELVSAMEEFETLNGFLEHISLVMENTTSSQGAQVSLMTLHAAKGLEFDVVFLPGWEEGVFPNQRALDENGAAGLEEERRLAYVGLTRARRHVEISFAANRRLHGLWQAAIPSRFVQELPAEHVEINSDKGLYGNTLAAAQHADQWVGPEFAGRRHGPGYARRRGMGTPTAAPTIEGQGYLIEQKASGRFSVGDRVFHQKFGMGNVLAVDGGKLDIEFDKAGRKKVVESFVQQP